MKKLMIAAAIVCAAAMSQAAAINWQTEGYNFVDEKGTVHTAATAPAGQFVLVYLGTGTADWDNAKVVNTGSIDYGSGKSGNYAKASGSYSWTADAEGKGEVANGDIFGVMFKDGDGNLVKLSTVGGEEIDPTFTVSGLGSNTYAGTHYFATSDYTVASVPEPTSAMLLLLGVAGLALRRRRA